MLSAKLSERRYQGFAAIYGTVKSFVNVMKRLTSAKLGIVGAA
jgi:hypothetical protein